MTEAIKEIGVRVNKSRSVRKVTLFYSILYKVLEILLLALVGGYLIYRETDTITIGVGTALAIWGLAKLVNVAYRAESNHQVNG